MKSVLGNRPRVQEAYSALAHMIDGLEIGMPLPPVPDVMLTLSASRATVDRAYDLLEARGLIERVPRKGVFVANPVATGEIGIVLSDRMMTAEASPAYRMATAALTQALRETNPRWQVRMHLGEGSVSGWEMPASLDVLQKDVLTRLRAVFTFHELDAVESRLEEAGVPVVLLGAHGGRHRVGVDMEAFYSAAVKHLADAGCRSVCLLWPRYTGPRPRARRTVAELCAPLAGNAGLAFRHLDAPHGEGGWTEQAGHALFTRFWTETPRADGVIVADDVLCAGVLRAMLQLRVEPPRDLRLLSYANRKVPLPYHRAVTRYEFDVERLAATAVAMMRRLLNGHEPVEAEQLLPGKLVEGETA
ncbi:MAG: GntR family transcriptional regulator [Lentisphaerae bacterium]|nr:GntR family transcriptional regulator [Lentisphaerota bacterium]